MSPASDITVAVVGGGIAGLTAALRLVERGYRVTVYEERIHLGGKLGAHRHRIARLDEGTHDFAGIVSELGQGRVHAQLRDAIQAALRQDWDGEQREDNCLGDRPPAPFPPDRGLSATLAVAASPPGSPDLREGALQAWRITDLGRGGRVYVVRRFERRAGQGRLEVTDAVYHEHCYHMYLNWYHNFWQLMREIGRDRDTWFSPCDGVGHLFPGPGSVEERLRYLSRAGSPDAMPENLVSGVAPVPDMFLWFYSLADLVSESFDPDRYLDKTSVDGFLRSRWYATDEAAEINDYVLAKAFSVHSYLTSVVAYRQFVEYSFREPDPFLWLLDKNSEDGLLAPLEAHLATFVDSAGQPLCRIVRGARAECAGLTPDNLRIAGLRIADSDIYGPGPVPARADADEDDLDIGDTPAGSPGAEPPPPPPDPAGIAGVRQFDYVVLAVPPSALANLIEPFRERAGTLGNVRKLQSGVTASLDLYFNRRLPEIPDYPVVVRRSRLGLTFIDNAQVWLNDSNLDGRPDPNATCLNVAATDFPVIAGMSREEARDAILRELKQYVPFADADIDYGRTYLQMNTNEPLFVNEVGSEPWRPASATDIPNLFLAGDFCDNPIGIVTVEGAVASGLVAVRALQAQVRADGRAAPGSAYLEPVEVLEPERYPLVALSALKLLLTPYLAPAKAWSRLEAIAREPDQLLSRREWTGLGRDVLMAPGTVASDCWNFAIDATRWWLEFGAGLGDD